MKEHWKSIIGWSILILAMLGMVLFGPPAPADMEGDPCIDIEQCEQND
jgi:hypothetical protein